MSFCDKCGNKLRLNSLFCNMCGNTVTIQYQKQKKTTTKSKTKTSLAKGHDLEKQVENFFKSHGYKTERNKVLEGKSGGSHEIDVLAEKSDGITTIQLMVECKAWSKPIEKDVVSKVNYVVRDLGLNKGIIVALSGYRIGAKKSAKQLGIELWGKNKVEKLLGKTAVSDIKTKGFAQIALAFPPRIEQHQAYSMIINQTKRFLSGHREAISRFEFVWLPCYLFKINHTSTVGVFNKKLRSRFIWNLYNGLDGLHITDFDRNPSIQEYSMSGTILKPLIEDKDVTKCIIQIFKRANKARSFDSRQKYLEQLTAMGIPVPVTSISIGKAYDVYYPLYMAVLAEHGTQRVLAVDSFVGMINEKISHVLTMHISHIRPSQ